MIPLDTAVTLVLERTPVHEPEIVQIADAAGRVLRERIRAPRDVPPFDNAALDGVALRGADLPAAGAGVPPRLRLAGEVAAGDQYRGTLGPGEAVRIMTGAPLPPGADTVVGVEDLAFEGGFVTFLRPVRPGANVRRAGEDLQAGSEPIAPGTRLTPAALGVIASTGVGRVAVGRRPTVAILATGDEVLPPGAPWRPGAIYSSNSVALAACVIEAGGLPLDCGIAGDDLDETARRLHAAFEANAVVTTGGVSMGTYDHVRTAAAQAGVESVFWQVAIRPGKPVFFGVRGRVPLFGLPGNPASALITFEEIVRPALLRMQGATGVRPPLVDAVLASPYAQKPGRLGLVRGRVAVDAGVLKVTPVGRQGSGVLSSLAEADALIHVPPEATELPAGTHVKVRLIGHQQPAFALTVLRDGSN